MKLTRTQISQLQQERGVFIGMMDQLYSDEVERGISLDDQSKLRVRFAEFRNKFDDLYSKESIESFKTFDELMKQIDILFDEV